MSEVVFYTTYCPRCKILKMKLDSKSIPYETVDDQGAMLAEGIQTAPALRVDGELMKFPEAMRWVDNFQ